MTGRRVAAIGAALLLTMSARPHVAVAAGQSPRGVTRAVFAVSADRVATARYSAIEVRSLRSRAETAVLRGHPSDVDALRFSDAGGWLASASWSQVDGEGRATVCVWSDLDRSESPRRKIEVRAAPVTALALGVGEQGLAAGTAGGEIILWGADLPAERLRLTGHSSGVRTLAFSKGSRLASVDADGTVRLWNVSTGALERSIAIPHDRILSIAFDPGSGTLAAGTAAGATVLFDLETGAESGRPSAVGAAVLDIAFSIDRRRLSVVREDGTTEFLGLGPDTEVRVAGARIGPLAAAAYSADGGRLAVASARTGAVSLFEVDTAAAPRVLYERKDSNGLHPVAVNPVDQSLAFSTDAREMRGAVSILRIGDQAPSSELRVADLVGRVTALAFSPDGRTLAAAVTEVRDAREWSHVVLWDIASGREVRRIDPGGRVDRLLIGGGGALVIRVGFWSGLWDVATGAVIRPPRRGVLGGDVLGVTTDGRQLVLQDTGGLALWDVASWRAERTVPFRAYVQSVAFAPDGRSAAVSLGDKSLVLVDSATWQQTREFARLDELAHSLAFSSDGTRLAVAQGETVRLLAVPSGRATRTLVGARVGVGPLVVAGGGATVTTVVNWSVVQWDVLARPILRPLPVEIGAAPVRRTPAMTSDQLRDILANQPDFRASMRVSNEQRFPEGIVTGRVARSGSTFRLEPGGAFSSRASSEKAIPATESAWIFAPDAKSVTVLAPRRRAYRVLDLEGRGDSGDDMTGFALLGLFLTMPYPMLVDGPLREQGVVMIDEGEEMVGGHRCVKIRAATKNRQYGWVLYVATDLRNLIVKVVVDDWPGGEMFSFDLEGLAVALEGISLRADDALFKPPANYRRDDTLHVDLQPHERFARRADPEPERESTPNDPPRCGTIAVAPQRVVAGQRVALTVHATDVDGDVLTYTWASTRGRIEGSAASVTFDTTGLAPGVYTITVSVYDGFTAPVQCTAEVRVDAP